jgi:hypothetical protein
MRIALPLVICVAATGCVGRWYREPPETKPYAVLAMHRAQGSQSYMAFDNSECTRTSGMGLMRVFGAGSDQIKTDRLQPRKRVFILASTNFGLSTSDVPMQYIMSTCDNLISFVPAESHKYDISHVLREGACLVVISDSKTQVEPESLQLHPVPKWCGGD